MADTNVEEPRDEWAAPVEDRNWVGGSSPAGGTFFPSDSAAYGGNEYQGQLAVDNFMRNGDGSWGGGATGDLVAGTGDYNDSGEVVAGKGTYNDDVTPAPPPVPSPSIIGEGEYDAKKEAIKTVTDPTLPEGAEHTYQNIIRTDDDTVDITDEKVYAEPAPQVQPVAPLPPVEIEAARVDAEAAIESVGFEAAIGEAAQSGNVDRFLVGQVPDAVAAQMTAITGEAAQGIAAQVDINSAMRSLDSVPAQMQAVIAALPEEALVTKQMDDLLAGLEGGNTPLWARPAVEQAEAMMAARGLGRSTVGRDAMFNAIISAAQPLAESNARALQQRSSENLGYANAAAQFNAEMQQQTKMQLNDAQTKFIGLNAELRQGMELANLDARNKMEMVNLEHMNAANKENMTAEQETRLTNLRKEVELGIQRSQTKTTFGIQDLQNQQSMIEKNMQSANDAIFKKLDTIMLGQQINAQSQNDINKFVESLNQSAALQRQGFDFDGNKFNANMEQNRNFFNSGAYKEIMFSNAAAAQLRNRIDTAGINAVNATNAQNFFGMSMAAMGFLQQDYRDLGSWAQQTKMQTADLTAQMAIAKMQLDGDQDAKDRAKWGDIFSGLSAVASWIDSVREPEDKD